MVVVAAVQKFDGECGRNLESDCPCRVGAKYPVDNAFTHSLFLQQLREYSGDKSETIFPFCVHIYFKNKSWLSSICAPYPAVINPATAAAVSVTLGEAPSFGKVMSRPIMSNSNQTPRSKSLFGNGEHFLTGPSGLKKLSQD